MATLHEKSPENFLDYVKIVENLLNGLNEGDGPLWFRGTSNAEHLLVPALYRHEEYTDVQDLLELEKKLTSFFQERGAPYHARDLTNELERLVFMQHYGVPTRLLDWTENPLTALHFAFASRGKEKQSKPAAVWVLNTSLWNKTALNRVRHLDIMPNKPLPQNSPALRRYTLDILLDSERKKVYPVALNGVHNSPRIAAQQGAFIIFGNNKTSMQDLVTKKTFPPEALTQIQIFPQSVENMKSSLVKQGVRESTVFPDLDGLAREMKQQFGFEQ